MHGKTFLLVARAARPLPALCVHWAAKLCWAGPRALLVGPSKGELDLGGQEGHRALAAAITPTVGSVHGEGPASLQHSCLAQAQCLNSCLKSLKMVLSMPTMLSISR